MGNSALHAIAIEGLRQSNPAFYQEYCLLIEGISQQIRELAKAHKEDLDYSCFIETFDRVRREPVLNVVIGIKKNNFQLHIHIHQHYHFIVDKPEVGEIAYTAKDALKIVAIRMQDIK